MFHCTYENLRIEVVLRGGPLSFCLRLCVRDSFLDVGPPICIPGGEEEFSPCTRLLNFDLPLD